MKNKRGVGDYVEDKLGGTRQGNSDEIICDCINCGASKHLYVNAKSGLANCFRCGYGANLIKLVRDIEGIPHDKAILRCVALFHELSKPQPSAKSLDELYALLLSVKEIVTHEITLPKNCVPITHKDAERGRKYLASRGIKNYDAYNLLYVAKKDEEEPRYYRHIIFPVNDRKGKLSYWTTRAAFEPDKSFPKSYHPTGVPKETLIGMDVVRKKSLAIIVEGPLDALALNGYGLAALGKQLTEAQCALLIETFTTLIVCFDNDANSYTLAAAKMLKKLGAKKVFTCTPTWSDPCDALRSMRAKELLHSVLENSQRYPRHVAVSDKLL